MSWGEVIEHKRKKKHHKHIYKKKYVKGKGNSSFSGTATSRRKRLL